jgi:hypothetical protein
LSRKIPFVPLIKEKIQMPLCERSQDTFPSTPSATPNKKMKVMFKGEVNAATSDEGSDNEQL